MANNNMRMHSGHMMHKKSEDMGSGVSTRASGSQVTRDVPRINPMSMVRGNPGAAGGTDSGNTAKNIPAANPPHMRGEGDTK